MRVPVFFAAVLYSGAKSSLVMSFASAAICVAVTCCFSELKEVNFLPSLRRVSRVEAVCVCWGWDCGFSCCLDHVSRSPTVLLKTVIVLLLSDHKQNSPSVEIENDLPVLRRITSVLQKRFEQPASLD